MKDLILFNKKGKTMNVAKRVLTASSDREKEDLPNVVRFQNSIYFYDEMDRDSILLLQRLCLEIKAERYDCLHLVIASEGGYPYSIYEFLKNLGIAIITYINGYCCSAATVMYLAGHKRYIAPTAFFLIHSMRIIDEETYEWKQGNTTDQLDTIRKHNDIAFKPIYKAETKIPEKILEAMFNDREVYITPQECLKWKIAHEIGVFISP
jgi:ATP-dependent protease ClpP protease subunit